MMKAQEMLELADRLGRHGRNADYSSSSSICLEAEEMLRGLATQPQTPTNRDEIARIIDPEAMGLAHKLGRPDLALTAEMQERIRTVRAKADAIVLLSRPDRQCK